MSRMNETNELTLSFEHSRLDYIRVSWHLLFALLLFFIVHCNSTVNLFTVVHFHPWCAIVIQPKTHECPKVNDETHTRSLIDTQLDTHSNLRANLTDRVWIQLNTIIYSYNCIHISTTHHKHKSMVSEASLRWPCLFSRNVDQTKRHLCWRHEREPWQWVDSCSLDGQQYISSTFHTFEH